jgi:two-component SAPR family response regulator
MTTPDIEIAPFTLRLLGDFEARIGGRAMPKTRTRKERWLLALLVLGKGREIARASLAQTLWPFPDHPVDLAAYNLRRSLSDLRKALGTQAARLESPTPQTLRFSLEGMLVDVLEFDRLAASDATDDLTIALDLYQGLLLPDCTEPWAATERERRHQAYLQILETLARRSMLEGDPRGAERYLRLAVAADPLRESTSSTAAPCSESAARCRVKRSRPPSIASGAR